MTVQYWGHTHYEVSTDSVSLSFQPLAILGEKKSLTVIFGKVFSSHVKSLKIWIGEKEYIGTAVTFFKKKISLLHFALSPIDGNFEFSHTNFDVTLLNAVFCNFEVFVVVWGKPSKFFLFYWRRTDSSGCDTIL